MTKWEEKTAAYTVHDETQVKGFFGEYRWMSNFHVSPVDFRGNRFTSVEAAYQSAKCSTPEEAKTFQSMSPLDSKRAGGRTNLPSNWEEIKLGVMSECVLSKFSLDEGLKARLLATGYKYLEETNHWNDTYWGVCNGMGLNMLGKTLMQVRKILSK